MQLHCFRTQFPEIPRKNIHTQKYTIGYCLLTCLLTNQCDPDLFYLCQSAALDNHSTEHTKSCYFELTTLNIWSAAICKSDVLCANNVKNLKREKKLKGADCSNLTFNFIDLGLLGSTTKLFKFMVLSDQTVRFTQAVISTEVF